MRFLREGAADQRLKLIQSRPHLNGWEALVQDLDRGELLILKYHEGCGEKGCPCERQGVHCLAGRTNDPESMWECWHTLDLDWWLAQNQLLSGGGSTWPADFC